MIPVFQSSDPRFPELFQARLKRNAFALPGEPLVLQILEDVRRRGDQALFYWSEKLDKVKLTPETVSLEPRAEALSLLPPSLREALETAHRRITAFHARQQPRSYEEKGELTLAIRYIPLERVGIYIPGGKALYPSTVLMAGIPARVAGVREIVMVTPPRREGLPPVLEAAAWLAGVQRIYTIGGVQALAALAFGTETIPRVDKIVGPGNRYVAEAKRLLFGFTGIDMVAGPTELCIIADGTANPRWLAADLIAQAEHDEAASPLLFTTALSHLEEVPRALEELLKEHPREAVARKSLSSQGMIVHCSSLEEAVSYVNDFAPEHLELMVENPGSLLPLIRNAGAVFLGGYSPEALGDYLAGSNHILPTQGAARFASALGVEDFYKRISVITCNASALKELAPHVITLAEAEELPGHGGSVAIRFKDG